MQLSKFLSVVFASVLTIISFGGLANTPSQVRTFISIAGTDTANTVCGPTTPCRSLQTAIDTTFNNGEVVVLTSGAYGNNIQITRGVNIKAAPGLYAGVGSFTGLDGITINGSGIKVTLSNLQIVGGSPLNTGVNGNNGIKVLNADSVQVIDSIISGMAQNGILQQAGAVVVVNSAVNFNSVGINTSTSTGAVTKIEKSHVSNNASDGLLVGNGVDADVSDSYLSGNGGFGIHINASTSPGVQHGSVVTVDNSELMYNALGGAYVFDTGAVAANHDGAFLWLLKSKIRPVAGPGFTSSSPALIIEGAISAVEISHSVIGGGLNGGPVISILDPALTATTARNAGYMHLFAHLGTNQVFGNGNGNPEVYLNGVGCAPTFLNNGTEPTCGVDTNGAGGNPY